LLVAAAGEIARAAAGYDEEARRRRPLRQVSERVGRGEVGPVQVFDHQHQRLVGGQRVDRLAELTKHALAIRNRLESRRRARRFRPDSRHLHQPRRRPSLEHLWNTVADVLGRETTEKVEDGKVRLAPRGQFDALPPTDARTARRPRVLDKVFEQRRLAKAGVTGHEHGLPLAAPGAAQGAPKEAQLAAASNRRVSLRRCVHVGNQAITAPPYVFNRGRSGVVHSQCSANLADAHAEHGLTHCGFGPTRAKELLFRHQPAATTHQFPEHGERFRAKGTFDLTKQKSLPLVVQPERTDGNHGGAPILAHPRGRRLNAN
jgi:hypothetical protein